MTWRGTNQPDGAKPGHCPAHYHRIRQEAGRQLFGCGRCAVSFRHLDERMEGNRKATVPFHVTINVTN